MFVVSDGRLEERIVQVSESSGDSLGVMAGVRPGERVVAVAREDLRDGQKIERQPQPADNKPLKSAAR